MGSESRSKGSEDEATTAGGRSAVARLAAVLAAAAPPEAPGDAGPTPRELAELLWFAQQLAPNEAGATGAGPGRRTGGPAATDPPPSSPEPPESEPGERPRTPPTDHRVPLHLPGAARPESAGPGSGTPLLAPAPPMLHHPLALQRALRPLKRRVPSVHARLLDEQATADRIAALGAHPDAWLPVLRPAPDRWLRLNLVYDAGPTMPVWRPLARELHTVLAQSGVFRTVTLHRATPDGRAHQVPVLPDGRTVTLVLSDCMGPQWRPGPAGDRWYRTLRGWVSRMPVSVVQPLPEHLWHGTALPAGAGVLTAPAAAAPTASLAFIAYDPYDPRARPAPGPALPLPVLEPTPTWLANWAALIAAPGGGHTPGALAWLPATPVQSAEEGLDVGALSAQELVLSFRATASPEAFRLAGHLALAEPNLSVMRLVQRALERSPRPQHLAEVILSGMLRAVPGPPGSYAFRSGVRELLLRSLPRTARTRTREFLARVGGLIDERTGLAAGEIPAVARGRGAGDGGRAAFATVRAETVRRLSETEEQGLIGERYRVLGLRGSNERMWTAVDVRTDRTVVVHLYEQQAMPPELFLRQARALAGLRHPSVVRVLDFGVDGERPYLVAEFVDGVTLAELQLGSGPGVSFRVFARLVRDVVPALEALHDRSLVRGQLGWDGLLLRPDGSVVLSRFALGEEAEGHDPSSDFLVFRSLLRELASHNPTGLRFQRMLSELAQNDDPVRAVRQLPHSPAFSWALSETESDRVNVTMLGPLNIRNPGRSLPLPSPEGQALLCMLLLRQGRRMSGGELAQGLWEEPHSPDAARRRLRDVAAQVRYCLGPGTLAALADGYALHTPGDYLDVRHFEELVGERADDQDPHQQRSLIQDALSLWYGEPLDGVPGPAAKATRTRLHDMRLTLCVRRAELDLELGDFEGAAQDLDALLPGHPEHRDLRRLHILALMRQGRVAEAIESFESYEAHWKRRYAAPVDPALQELRRELQALPEPPPHPVITFLASGLDERPDQARFALGSAVLQLLSIAGSTQGQYEVQAVPDGYALIVRPDVDVQPVLRAVLRELAGALGDLADPPQVRVTFWHSRSPGDAGLPVLAPDLRILLEGVEADLLVVISPALHQGFANSPDVSGFQPVRLGSGTGQPAAWYRALRLPAREPEPEPERRDLVRGPFTIDDISRLASPDPGRIAIVHTQPDGPLTLLEPARPWGQRPPRRTTYYEVDLTVQRAGNTLMLPSSGGGSFTATAELSWHVDDPVSYVNSETTGVEEQLFEHLAREAARVTRRHPLRRAGAAQHAVHESLRRWPVPGLSVTCSVSLAAREERPPALAFPQGPSGFEAGQRSVRELVMAATVRIHRPAPADALDDTATFLGSGFFIAPNWVLTCAHVAFGGEGGEVTVVYGSSPDLDLSAVPARVAAALPDLDARPASGNWPNPDLALVRLSEPVEHDCVYVSERPTAYLGEGRAQYAGWTVMDGRLAMLDGTLSVQGTIGGWSSGVQIRLGGNELPPGVSGGPVVDPERGEVVGVLKARASRGPGGTATGVEQLRNLPTPSGTPRAEHDDLYQAVFHAHDRFHRDLQRNPNFQRHTWADVQSELGVRPGRTLAPHERVQLLGRLADLPPPVSTPSLVEILESLPDFVPSLPSAPRAWRDGLGVLYEHARDDGVMELVLDYAMQVVSAERPYVTAGTAAAQEALWDWVWQAAQGRSAAFRHRLARQRNEWLHLRRPPGTTQP
ncbi:SAV_2336 N-terminal domain-related protein [Streptomyces chartreusis]|uniref:SAV_2336 N-terminal domain-related protein n=1 Tax=Streptomyces chartreusis TaxID=1969 RepID=UPI0033ED8A8E